MQSDVNSNSMPAGVKSTSMAEAQKSMAKKKSSTTKSKAVEEEDDEDEDDVLIC